MNHLSAFAFGIGMAIGWVGVDIGRPALSDRFNTTRQILKANHTDFYLEKREEQNKIEKRIGELVCGKPTESQIRDVLIDYRHTVDFKWSTEFHTAMRSLTQHDLRKLYEKIGEGPDRW